MRARRLAGCTLALIGLLLLSACQEPVTYGTRVTIGAGDRLDARHPHSGEHVQRQDNGTPGAAAAPAAGTEGR
jgi:hypothetical protein